MCFFYSRYFFRLDFKRSFTRPLFILAFPVDDPPSSFNVYLCFKFLYPNIPGPLVVIIPVGLPVAIEPGFYCQFCFKIINFVLFTWSSCSHCNHSDWLLWGHEIGCGTSHDHKLELENIDGCHDFGNKDLNLYL